MDAVGLEHACLLGFSEGGAPSMMFAATYPERCDALILLETGRSGTGRLTISPTSRDARCSWALLVDRFPLWGTGV